jgi:hypothetical protein
MSSPLRMLAAVVALLGALGAPGTASAAFDVVPSPNAFAGNNLLNGVSASSPNDAWAVGSLCCSMRNSGTGALLEHWDGDAWTLVPGPDARFLDEVLNGVAAISPSDAWAVGRVKQSGYGGGTPLILHWDGSAWQAVTPPSGVTGELRAVSSDTLGGAWAVGDDGHGHPLALRCDVAACALVTLPQAGTVGRLRGIAAVAPNDVWAVGESDNKTLVMRWSGADWSVVASPNPDRDVNILSAVAGVSGSDVWAVGHQDQDKANTGVPPGTRTLAMHWDGTGWNVASAPNVDDNDSLRGVAATNAAAITAVGTFQDEGGEIPVLRTLGVQWGGSAWATLATPNVGATDNLLRAAAPIPGTPDVWAVGLRLTSGGPTQTLVLRQSADAAPTGSDPAPASGLEPASQPGAGEPPASGGPAPAREVCGSIRVTLALGRAGLRASSIRVSANGRRQVLSGRHRRVAVEVPYTGAANARVTVRIQGRGGKPRTITRAVALCHPAP